MIRKILAMLLSLMLALAMPLCASAANQHTLTVIPGDDLASIEVVKDVLDALSLTVVPGEKAAALTVSLNGSDIATVALGADTTGLYAQTDLVSDSVLYITWDDGFALLQGLVQLALESEGVELGEEEMQALSSALEEAKEAIQSGAATAALSDNGAHTGKEAMAEAAAMFGDDPKMVEYIETIAAKATEEKGVFTLEGRDPADQKESFTITGEDIAMVCETNYMRNMLAQTVSGVEGAEELDVDELLAQVREMYLNSGMLMTGDVYTVDDGETLVGMDMNMSMSLEAEDQVIPVTMTLRYDRLSAETGVSHKGEMTIAVEEMQLLAKLDVNKGADGVTEGYAGMLADGTELVATYAAKPVEETARERVLSLYMREDATAVLAPTASDRPLISFKVVTAPDAQNRLAAMEQATADNSVNVMSLSDEEMDTLMADATTRAMQAFYKALSDLPASVINLMFGSQE